MQETTAAVPMHEMMLQLATSRQVYAFDLGETNRVTLGRHDSNDIQLRSRRVSNYHAEILIEVEGMFLQDRGSTNGTILNDEEIRDRRALQTGDRVGIGNFVFTVSVAPKKEKESLDYEDPVSVGTVGNIVPIRGISQHMRRVPSRAGRDLSLPDLLTRLSTTGATVKLILRSQIASGSVFVENGFIVHCECGATRKEKALYRLLALQQGTYEIRALPDPSVIPRTLDESTGILVIEGLQEIEALESLTAKLPIPTYEVSLNKACSLPVSSLTPEEFEIYECLIRYRTVIRVLEESFFTDYTILRLIHRLLGKGFFRAEQSATPSLEETAYPGSKSI